MDIGQYITPSANKNDFKRVRIGPKSYASHMKYILEKTQTEVYLEFKDKVPHIKISQRLFEKIKPYFVIPARPRDRETCCKYHVEARFLFKSCMEYRKHTTPNNNEFPVFEHLCDLLNCTLCPKNQGQDFHNLDCIERNCPQCGVLKFKLSENELSCDELAPDVEWMCYEYVKFKFKNTEKKKLCLVKKKTKPGSMFKYFYDILSNFSSHVFRSKWQSVQLQ